MNRFYVIGLDDNMKQYFPPEVLEIISSHRVFSGGVRHHEIVRSLLPEKADWIDIKVPLDEVFDRYRSYDGRESIVVFASGDPLFSDSPLRFKTDCRMRKSACTRHLIPCNSWRKTY